MRLGWALLLLCSSLAACSRAPRGGIEASAAQPADANAIGEGDVPFGPPPPPPPPPSAPATPLRVLVGGDLLPHRPSLVAPASIASALAPLRSVFAGADAVVANYEAATGEVDPNAFRLAYAAPHGWLAALPGAGISAVSVANNHACDLGEPGLVATIDDAAAAGLVAIGGDAKDPWAPRVIVERSGKRVCAVAWTTLVNANEGACARSSRLAFAPTTPKGKQRIDRAIKAARALCDATIAIVHGGEEYRPQTTQVMDQAGHAAEAGADVVVIHHPHIASPVVVHETKDGRAVPIFASVGNLVTNQGESWKPPMFPVLRENRRLVCVNGWTRLGVLADLAFRFDTTPARLDWALHLTWIDNQHTEDRSVAVPKISARLLDPDKDHDVVARLSEDPVGPVALFADPCWLERPDAADDPRCHASLVHGPADALTRTVSRTIKPRDGRHHHANP